MRWLIVLPFDRPEHMGVDFRDELTAMGHEVRTFAYRRNNPLYKNRGTKAAYQVWILRRLERLCVEWRPSLVLVIKGGPITPGLVRRKGAPGRPLPQLLPGQPALDDALRRHRGLRRLLHQGALRAARARGRGHPQPPLSPDVLRAGHAPPGHAHAGGAAALRQARQLR